MKSEEKSKRATVHTYPTESQPAVLTRCPRRAAPGWRGKATRFRRDRMLTSHITAFRKGTEDAVLKTMQSGEKITYAAWRRPAFFGKASRHLIKPPSDRCQDYFRPQAEIDPTGRKHIGREGNDRVIPCDKKEDSIFYNIPTSPAADLILRVLGTGRKLKRLENGRVSHNRRIKAKSNDLYPEKKRIQLNSKNASATLEVADLKKLKCARKAKKLFIYLLIKLNEEAFSRGTLRRAAVSFPLRDLVDIGWYRSPRAARTGFKDSMALLSAFKLNGSLRKGSKAEEQEDLVPLFTGFKIKRGMCEILLNKSFNWNTAAAYYTVLPKNYFKLSNSRAGDLLFYIFYLARQNMRKIEEKGYFTISFEAIQERLSLPSVIESEKKIKNPGRDIREGINTAISGIMRESDGNLVLSAVCKDKGSIADFLNNGYLKVELKGRYAEFFIALSRKAAKKIAAASHNLRGKRDFSRGEQDISRGKRDIPRGSRTPESPAATGFSEAAGPPIDSLSIGNR